MKKVLQVMGTDESFRNLIENESWVAPTGERAIQFEIGDDAPPEQFFGGIADPIRVQILNQESEESGTTTGTSGPPAAHNAGPEAPSILGLAKILVTAGIVLGSLAWFGFIGEKYAPNLDIPPFHRQIAGAVGYETKAPPKPVIRRYVTAPQHIVAPTPVAPPPQPREVAMPRVRKVPAPEGTTHIQADGLERAPAPPAPAKTAPTPPAPKKTPVEELLKEDPVPAEVPISKVKVEFDPKTGDLKMRPWKEGDSHESAAEKTQRMLAEKMAKEKKKQ